VVSAHCNDLQKSQLQPLPDGQPPDSKNVPDSKLHCADAFHCCHFAALCAIILLHYLSSMSLRPQLCASHMVGIKMLQCSAVHIQGFLPSSKTLDQRHGQLGCACAYKCTIKHGKKLIAAIFLRDVDLVINSLSHLKLFCGRMAPLDQV